MNSARGFIPRAAGLLLVLIGGVTAMADVPRMIHYQGKLRDAGGAAVNATVSLRFRLYDAPSGLAALLFDETHAGVGVADGLFSALIGSVAGGVPDSALDASEVYLGVAINGGAELSPRTRIAASPHALLSRSAEQLVRPNTILPAVSVDAAGNVGIGTASPGAKLEVAGQIKITGGTPAAGEVLTSDGTGTGLATWEPVSSGGDPSYGSSEASPDDAVFVDDAANVGIGTTGPARRLDIVDATNPQLRLTQAAGSAFAEFQVTSSGSLVANVAGVSNQWVLGGGGTVGEAWNVSTASWVHYFQVSAQESDPSALFFRPDGTKMYVLGLSGDDVNEYDLSPAWNVATASFLQTFSVSAQDGDPTGLFFKPDGTKMYVLGSAGDAVYEYGLSSAWNVSTASFGQSFSVATQETVPAGLFFKPDGIKMYVVGTSGDDVNEYDLSTAWDVSTASFVQTFSVAAQEDQPRGLFFKSDGTKMYVVGSAGQDVNEYDLSAAWDVSTAGFLQTFRVATQDTFPHDLFFTSDGTKMYVVGSSGSRVHEYNLLSNLIGNVGIGTSTPGNILTIKQSSATDPIADAWTSYSSRRWKKNITEIDAALAKVQQLRGVYYDRKADGKHDIGLIAEEVGEVVPEVVVYENNGVDAKSVDYARLVALLIESTKQQQKQLEALQVRLEAQQKELSSLRRMAH